jgi:hypothetical protein
MADAPLDRNGVLAAMTAAGLEGPRVIPYRHHDKSEHFDLIAGPPVREQRRTQRVASKFNKAAKADVDAAIAALLQALRAPQ